MNVFHKFAIKSLKYWHYFIDCYADGSNNNGQQCAAIFTGSYGETKWLLAWCCVEYFNEADRRDFKKEGSRKTGIHSEYWLCETSAQ